MVKVLSSLEIVFFLGDCLLLNLILVVKLYVFDGSLWCVVDILVIYVKIFIIDKDGEGFDVYFKIVVYLVVNE